MTYALGVDLGTTYTAAAIQLGHRLEIVDLGTHTAAIPSVVYLRDDGEVLTGEAAIRRGATDPAKLSREFKRRMGDTTAILLGGVPYSVDALMASMLRAVVTTVTERQGTRPGSIGIAHPANWGQYKKDLLDQAVRRADLDDVVFVTEPEAAAIHYATLERLDPGATIAVYDLGGGTFDVAALRKTVDGFELIGEPEGIERLGGIDFDEAVFRHVVGAVGGAIDELDPDDPVAQAAASRLRHECVAAKEALSGDTEVSIPVILPTVHTEVRLTRAEFEAMIRPALGDTLIVLRRCLRSAGLEPGDLHSVLLVGGSSRIPLIAQMVAAELGRPVALDVHPKHSVALGAAALASGAVATGAASAATTPAAGGPAVDIGPLVVAEAADQTDASDLAALARDPEPTGVLPVTPAAVPATPATEPIGATQAMPPSPPPGPPPPAPRADDRPARRGRTGLLVGGLIVALAVVGGAILLIDRGGDDTTAGATGDQQDEQTDEQTGEPTDEQTGDPTDEQTGDPTGEPDISTPETTTPETTAAATTTTVPPEPCAGTDEPCVSIESLRVTDDGAIEVTWTPHNFVPDVAAGFHAHLYWSNATAAQASSDAPDGERVEWDAVDQTVHTSATVLVLANRPPDADGVCGTVGIAPAHTAYDPSLFHCLPLPL